MLSQLVFEDLVLVEPQGNFFLRTLDSVGAVADVPANVLYFNQSDPCVLRYFKDWEPTMA